MLPQPMRVTRRWPDVYDPGNFVIKESTTRVHDGKIVNDQSRCDPSPPPSSLHSSIEGDHFHIIYFISVSIFQV